MLTLNLIGCGRVGQTLARLWRMHGVRAVQDVCTTSLPSAQAACEWVGAGHAVAHPKAMRPADLWMLAVPDAHIASAALALADHAKGMPPAIAFHCSGAQSAAALAPLKALGWQVASAHCILSFASPEVALVQFPGTLCALEGDDTACATLRDAFRAMGAQCFNVASQDKLLYHAAAVFATNFLPVLQTVAEDLWRSTGVPPEHLPALRAALLHNAVHNITTLGPQAALTGPAARGDTAAIDRQATAVSQWNAQAGAAYAALSALGLQIAAKP